jgi:hypothetical protein
MHPALPPKALMETNCHVCGLPILETGTGLDGLPVHIGCYHAALSQVKPMKYSISVGARRSLVGIFLACVPTIIAWAVAKNWLTTADANMVAGLVAAITAALGAEYSAFLEKKEQHEKDSDKPSGYGLPVLILAIAVLAMAPSQAAADSKPKTPEFEGIRIKADHFLAEAPELTHPLLSHETPLVAHKLLGLPNLTHKAQVPQRHELRYSVAYDFKQKSFGPVVGTKIAGLRDFLGGSQELELWFPVVGVSLSGGRMNYGAAAVYPVKVGTNAWVLIGISGRLEGEKVGAGLVLGLEIRG